MKVFGAPSRYLQGAGVIQALGACAAQCGQKLAVVIDQHVLPLLQPDLQTSLANAGLEAIFLPFAGSLNADTASKLVAASGSIRPDVIAAVGGGRAMDAGKAMADHLQVALITIPTAASNDAPTSKNYVLYDDNGHLSEVRHLARSPDFVIVDTRILAAAPKHLFVAGLGDALSKKAEAEACARGHGVNMFSARPTRLALSIAQHSYDILLQHGCQAFDVAGTGTPTEDFEAAVEAMILMAGIGFESGGLSLPHALTRGLSFLPTRYPAVHGREVAYGLVVHHELLGLSCDAGLMRIFDHVGLPKSLIQLTGHKPSLPELRRLVAVTMNVRHMQNLPLSVDADALLSALLRVEEKYSIAMTSVPNHEYTT